MIHAVTTKFYGRYEVLVYRDYRRSWIIEERRSQELPTWQAADLQCGEVGKEIRTMHYELQIDENAQRKSELLDRIVDQFIQYEDLRPIENEIREALELRR